MTWMNRTRERRILALVGACLLMAACGRAEAPAAQPASQAPASQPAGQAPAQQPAAQAPAARPGDQGRPPVEPQAPAARGGEPVNANARALATFEARVDDYITLHRKLEQTLPKLKKESNPQEIDQHQRALARIIQEQRRGAKPGDIFTPESQRVVKELLARVFGGPDGKALRASIMDENPGTMKLVVNTRYPDTVPLSTVPPQVLQGLPKLPEELEYRFIGDRLILMDVHAHLIADLVEHALPS
jgi:hypothetical protein